LTSESAILKEAGRHTGQHSMQDVLDMAERLEGVLRDLMITSTLREHPDRYRVNRWLIDAYRRSWLDKGQWGYSLG
jgi:hypothetical protein